MADCPSSPREQPKISLVVPVYNERATVAEVIRRIREIPLPKEIIVVDDGSTDGTDAALATIDPGQDLRVLRHPRNRGKGAALRTAFAQVAGEIVIIQDADLEYDPRQYSLLIRPIVEGIADVVYGSRFLSAGRCEEMGTVPISSAPHHGLGLYHYLANRAVTMLSNAFTGLSLSDMETCYKVFRRGVIEAIGPGLKEDRFGIDPELTAKIARRKYSVCEVAVSYTGRTYREGKKFGPAAGFRVLWSIVRYWWSD
jgi:glycosyltransferase involved in cell wall biosynthesis